MLSLTPNHRRAIKMHRILMPPLRRRPAELAGGKPPRRHARQKCPPASQQSIAAAQRGWCWEAGWLPKQKVCGMPFRARRRAEAVQMKLNPWQKPVPPRPESEWGGR